MKIFESLIEINRNFPVLETLVFWIILAIALFGRVPKKSKPGPCTIYNHRPGHDCREAREQMDFRTGARKAVDNA